METGSNSVIISFQWKCFKIHFRMIGCHSLTANSSINIKKSYMYKGLSPDLDLVYLFVMNNNSIFLPLREQLLSSSCLIIDTWKITILGQAHSWSLPSQTFKGNVVVLKRTGVGDWCFDNLGGSHLQS